MPVPQAGFGADSKVLHPERHQTDEQKEANRRKERARRQHLERLRASGSQDAPEDE
jgi:hypothetical protein